MDQPVAIITGAGRGIGRAVAIELAQAGYRLVLSARSSNELNETAGLAREAGAGDVTVTIADVSRSEQVQDVVETSLKTYRRIDAVIHCAGVAPAVALARMTDSQWHDVLNTNLSSAFYLSRAVWPTFERQKGGVIVLVSSVAARDPFDGLTAYAAAKAGINAFTLSASREGAKIGVRVHAVAPGATETAMFRGLMTESQFPKEKTLDPADVARVIVQCVSGDLKYTSGEVIYVRKTAP